MHVSPLHQAEANRLRGLIDLRVRVPRGEFRNPAEVTAAEVKGVGMARPFFVLNTPPPVFNLCSRALPGGSAEGSVFQIVLIRNRI